MRPTMGRMVIFSQPTTEQLYNGHRDHPAVINHVWGPGEVAAVNLTVFFDGGPAATRWRVPHEVNAGVTAACWRWPERVPG